MKEDVTIVIHQNFLNQIDEVANSLKERGLEITAIKDYGVIFGRLEKSSLQTVRELDEIESVERDNHVFLAPPDSEIQ